MANLVLRRWSHTQEESVWNQLVMGARFLQLELSSHDDGVEQLLEEFRASPNKRVARRELTGVLGELVKSVEAIRTLVR